MNRNVAIVVLLASMIVGGLVVDRDPVPPQTASPAVVDASVFPVASPPEAPSSTWFCAGGTADEEAFADHVVTIFNPGDAAVVATVTVYAGTLASPVLDPTVEALEPDETTTTTTAGGDADAATPAPQVRTVEIGPQRQVRIALSQYVTAPIASALVEAGVGGIVVEHEISSIHGNDRKPCATAASDTWHFAWGTTERTAREILVLFNPYPGDAVVDGRFVTEDGVREPVRFDGLVVPGESTLAVDLGDDVTRRAEVSATLTTRTGRIVADRIIRMNGEDGTPRGLTVQLGVPEPQRDWVFPDGTLGEDIGELYVVYNPTDEVAEVEIGFALEHPEENGIPEPVELSLAPGGATTVDLGADGRIPLGVAHSANVRSANDVPIVAERVITSSAARRGVSVTTGSPVAAEEWFFAAGAVSAGSDEWLTIQNIDPVVLAEVDIVGYVDGELVEPGALQDLVVEANERRVIRLGDHLQRDRLSLVVRSTEPIVVERGIALVGEGAIGLTGAIGVPSPVGLRMPADLVDAEVDVDLGDLDLEVDDTDEPPTAPDDVQLPDPDETIVIDDPDAPVTDPTSTTEPGQAATTDPDATATTVAGIPDTVPATSG